MCLIISHRGNINGPDPNLENEPIHIDKLSKTMHCEIDVWMINNNLFLGHDKPERRIDESFLKNPNLWCHAKNLNALEYMLDYNIHCFFHDSDSYTITSKKYIWTFPNKNICKKSVIVDLNQNWQQKQYDCFGVCSDYVLK
ncbi:MAG: hypothetical protein FJX80_00375 [Bacteroidetes bacterium]|nr:hypothetical protein [Bacteroidota bacterium]